MPVESDEKAIASLIELREKKFDELVENVKQFGKNFAIHPRQVVVQLTERFKSKKLVANE